MAWAPNIEQWRKFAIWEGRDIPADLMLAIIAAESGGIAGRLSQGTTKATEIPKTDGSKVTFNHAMGLAQVIPSVVKGWNNAFKDKAFFEDMTGTSERAARLQIRLGAWVYASGVRALHNWDPLAFPGASPGNATPEQLKLALIAYGIGPGAPGGEKGLIPKLEKLKAANRPLTVEALQAAFPKWGYSTDKEAWINRPVFGALKKWNLFQTNKEPGRPGLQKPFNPLSLPDLPTVETAAAKIKDNWTWLLIALGVWFFFGRKKPADKGGGVVEVGPAKVISRS